MQYESMHGRSWTPPYSICKDAFPLSIMSTSLSSCLVRSAIYPCFLATARLSADGSSLYSPASMSLGPVTGYCYGKSSPVGLLTRRVILFCGLYRTRVGHLSGPVCNGSLGQRTTLEVEAAVFRGRTLTSRHTRFQVTYPATNPIM